MPEHHPLGRMNRHEALHSTPSPSVPLSPAARLFGLSLPDLVFVRDFVETKRILVHQPPHFWKQKPLVSNFDQSIVSHASLFTRLNKTELIDCYTAFQL
jgi:hypothetical protein